MKDPDPPPENLSDRLKGLPKELENLQLEQLPPNKPSFLMVVLLSGVILILILILAIIFLHLTGRKFGRHTFQAHPVSQLVLPDSSPQIQSA